MSMEYSQGLILLACNLSNHIVASPTSTNYNMSRAYREAAWGRERNSGFRVLGRWAADEEIKGILLK